jgi:hypothetical protein
MRHLAAALAPRGVLKVSVPFCNWLEKDEMRMDWSASGYTIFSPMPVQPLEHVNYFRRPSLEKLGQAFGLTRVYIGAIESLNYSSFWMQPSQAAKNIGRAFAYQRYRNYYLFHKA